MPQEIVVLRCKQCLIFQTHLSKKSTKYSCKSCGEKQSISRIYSRGTGKECRKACQHLNSVIPYDGEPDDLDRELDRYEDEVHWSKIKSLNEKSGSPAHQPGGDSDEMTFADDDDDESESLTDTPSDSPDTDSGLRDEGFEEKNVIRDEFPAKSIEKSQPLPVTRTSTQPSATSVSSVIRSSAASLSAVSNAAESISSPPVSKKTKYSLFQ